MTVRESVPLSALTTFKIGGNASYVIECADDADIREALAFAEEKKLPWCLLGQGSNLLASDGGYDGVVIRPLASGISITEDETGALVVADAGYPWDELVREACERNLWGIENLAGIPGTAGAAPVQNIGAYGTELADTLLWVEAMNPESGESLRIPKEACAFGYRDSRFKHENLIILRIALHLSKTPAPNLSYKDLAALAASGASLDTPAKVADAVRGIRAKKFPDLAEWGTAGSFFKNPVIPVREFEKLKERYPELPGFPGSDGVKVPLAWILDRLLSLRGFSGRKTKLFEAQPLVVVAEKGASAQDVENIAGDVAARVKDATGIELEWEVRALPKK